MSSDNFYEGANYGFDSEYGSMSSQYSSNPATGIGIATDPRTANQLKIVSSQLNTGATTIEVSTVTPDVFESIPKEHFKELDRLRKIVGGNTELTLHAPVIEPTGMTKRGWEPFERLQAERQMISAVEKAHDLNPNGNVITTFHASAIPYPGETKVWEGEGEKKVPVIKELYVIDERSGDLAKMPMKPSAFEGKKPINQEEELKNLNKSNWYKNLHHVNFSAEQGAHAVENALSEGGRAPDMPGEKEILDIYKEYSTGKTDKENKIKQLEEKYPKLKDNISNWAKDKMQGILHGDIYLREAYGGLKEMFDQAYFALENSNTPEAKRDLEKMNTFREKIAQKTSYILEPDKIPELTEQIREGVHLLRSIENPQILKPFKQFALDKSSETFSNVALQSYKSFKENSPIISIENPPAGGGVIYNGEDLKKLIQETRNKFRDKAVKDLGMSKEQAQREAEKLIGATWDLGHINMIRKFGAGEKELIEETKHIAPFVKHMHLSDNFGMEHTELPMGMGNVPTKEMTKLVEQYNKKFKKIIEAGNWYQHFQTTPFSETLQHFGAPMYSAGNVSNSYLGNQGGYFAGYGMNPDIHHSLYGSGFSNLPVELGGQMSGKSRVSGNPME